MSACIICSPVVIGFKLSIPVRFRDKSDLGSVASSNLAGLWP